MNPLIEKVMELAAARVGVREVPPGSNRGPEVDTYIKSVGLPPSGSYPWCAAFVYYCFRQAATTLSMPNPCPRTGSSLGMWLKSTSYRVAGGPASAKRGMVFVLDLGHGTGHVGFIESVSHSTITTIEGNSNEAGLREGVGVFLRKRSFGPSLRGFLDFSA